MSASNGRRGQQLKWLATCNFRSRTVAKVSRAHGRAGMPHACGPCMQQAGRRAGTVAAARAYIRRLMRDGRLDSAEGQAQLDAIDRAERSGRPILVVGDIDQRSWRSRIRAA